MKIDIVSIRNIKGINPISIKLKDSINIVKGKGKTIFLDTIYSLLTKGIKKRRARKSEAFLRIYFNEEDDINEEFKPYTNIYMSGNKVMLNDNEVDSIDLSIYYYPNDRVYSCDWNEIKDSLIRSEYLYLLSIKQGYDTSSINFPFLESNLRLFYPDMRLIGVNSNSRESFLINNGGYEYEIDDISMEEKSILFLLKESRSWGNSIVIIDDIELNLSSNMLSKVIKWLSETYPTTQFIISTKSDIPSIPYINLDD